jgi:N-acetylglucosaminyldiphosphoundecaprenol N-acetyl-beta-D-mannosaminyltransferase
MTSSGAVEPFARPTPDLLGIPVAPLTMGQALDVVHSAIRQRRRLVLGVVNAAKVIHMRRDAELRDAVLSSDLILADGASVVWASRLLGQPLPERVAGIDLMMGMLQQGSVHSYKVFCLGATEEVLAATVGEIGRQFPGVRVVGQQHGYFDDDDAASIAAAIRDSHADILLVAMTSPKKERFLAKWGPTIDVPVCHGVGGSFDVVAGKVRRAPQLWQRAGLEWLYRVAQEPRRLWKRYFVTNSLFIGLVGAELCRQAPGRLASLATKRPK